MADHELSWLALALLLAALLFALAGALRWDMLRLRWNELFSPVPEQAPLQPLLIERPRQVPRRLHEAELQHQALHRRPGFHRSGRRG